MAQTPLSMKPTGWFQVAWSAEIGVGDVHTMKYFGQEMVAWRTTSGLDGSRLAMMLAAPAQAGPAAVRPCGDGERVDTVAEPWEDNTASYAEGRVRVAKLDTIEPAGAPVHLPRIARDMGELGAQGPGAGLRGRAPGMLFDDRQRRQRMPVAAGPVHRAALAAASRAVMSAARRSSSRPSAEMAVSVSRKAESTARSKAARLAAAVPSAVRMRPRAASWLGKLKVRSGPTE